MMQGLLHHVTSLLHCCTPFTALGRAALFGLLAYSGAALGDPEQQVVDGVAELIKRAAPELSNPMQLAGEQELAHWRHAATAPLTESQLTPGDIGHQAQDSKARSSMANQTADEAFYTLLARSAPKEALASALPGSTSTSESLDLLFYFYRHALRHGWSDYSEQARHQLLDHIVRRDLDQQPPALLRLAYEEVLGGATGLGRQTLRLAHVDHFSDPALIAEQALIRQLALWLDDFVPAFAFSTAYCQNPEQALHKAIEQLSLPAGIELLQTIRAITDPARRITVLLDLAEVNRALTPCLVTAQMLTHLAAETVSRWLQPEEASADDGLAIALEFLRLSRRQHYITHSALNR